jgi:hypothetical protein
MRVREKPKGYLPARFCDLARVKAAPTKPAMQNCSHSGRPQIAIPNQARKTTCRVVHIKVCSTKTRP